MIKVGYNIRIHTEKPYRETIVNVRYSIMLIKFRRNVCNIHEIGLNCYTIIKKIL